MRNTGVPAGHTDSDSKTLAGCTDSEAARKDTGSEGCTGRFLGAGVGRGGAAVPCTSFSVGWVDRAGSSSALEGTPRALAGMPVAPLVVDYHNLELPWEKT